MNTELVTAVTVATCEKCNREEVTTTPREEIGEECPRCGATFTVARTIARPHRDTVAAACPWAAKIAEVDGGFLCFESVEDFATWQNQI